MHRILASFVLLFVVSAHAATNDWYDANYTHRRLLMVSAGGTAVPTQYSVAVTFDHAAEVARGASLASGADVRVAHWNGTAWTELDRVLDNGSSWNSPQTTVWFRTVPALAPGATDDNYYLYYGHPGAAAAPANPSNVFLFWDDFSSGDLSRWTELPAAGLWQVTTAVARSGQHALTYPSEGQAERFLQATLPGPETDVSIESWWRISPAPGGLDVGTMARLTGASPNLNFILGNLEGSNGWTVFSETNGTNNKLIQNTGAAPANTWFRMALVVRGSQLRLSVDGAPVIPATGWFDATGMPASGAVGFQKWIVPNNTSFSIDDVVIRRFVEPEPAVSLGPDVPVSGGLPDGGTVLPDGGTVLPDGGVGDHPSLDSGPGRFLLTVGCSHALLEPWALLLSAALLLRRRRVGARRRSGPREP